MSRPISFFFTHPLHIISSLMMKYGKFIPDSLYLKIQYRILMGKKLELGNPQTFTEKIQWLKLNRRSSEMTQMVDKIEAKHYAASRIGNQYIIPTIGYWDSILEVNWESLPNQFVLKTTHGGGGTGVVIVKDKSKTNREETLNKLKWSLQDEGYTRNREWPYKNVPRRILAEEMIVGEDEKDDLTDYKIFCFNGEPKFIQVIRDRKTKESIDFFDTEWNHQEFIGLNPKALNSAESIKKPDKLEDMLSIAKKLSTGHPFLRVDLYQTKDTVLFGEMTFYPASGIGRFAPAEWDLKLGEMIKL